MRKQYILFSLCFAFILPIFLIYISTLDIKWFIASLIGFCIFSVISIVNDKEKFLLCIFGLSLSVNLDINLFVSPEFTYLRLLSGGISVSAIDISIFLLCLLWLVYERNSRNSINIRLILPIIFFQGMILAALLSFLNARYMVLSIYEFKKYILVFIIIIYLFFNMRHISQLKYIIYMLFIGIICSSIVGILQYKTGTSLGFSVLGETQEFFSQRIVGSISTIRRVSGLMLHANMFGIYLAMCLPIAYSLSFANLPYRDKMFPFVVTVIGTVALVLTFSRASLISFCFGMLFFCLVKRRKLFSNSNIIFLFIYLFAVVIICILWGGKIVDRFLHSPPEQLNYRFLLNTAAIKMILSHPFLGVGLNNFTAQLELFSYDKIIPLARYPVHNFYLLIMAETGIFSFVAFILFSLFAVKSGIESYFIIKDETLRNISLGMVSGLCAVFLNCMTDFTLALSPLFMLFFTISALIICIRYNLCFSSIS